jgi:hypothetical protein
MPDLTCTADVSVDFDVVRRVSEGSRGPFAHQEPRESSLIQSVATKKAVAAEVPDVTQH